MDPLSTTSITAVFTKFHGPTNYRGSKVTVYTQYGKYSLRKTYSWDYDLSPELNHRRAALQFIKEKNWQYCGEWVFGDTNTGCVAVCRV